MSIKTQIIFLQLDERYSLRKCKKETVTVSSVCAEHQFDPRLQQVDNSK
jgi:hypothetical protein